MVARLPGGLTPKSGTQYNGSAANLDNGITYETKRKEEDMPINSSMPLGDFIKYWMDTYKAKSVKPSTFSRLKTSADVLYRYPISHMPIGEIAAKHIERYLGELVEANYAFGSIKKQKELITASMKEAFKQEFIPVNRTVGTDLPSRYAIKKKDKDIRSYTYDEQERLKSVLATHKKPGYAAAELMLETGLRVGEALALDWDDISFDKKRIWVHKTIVNLADKGASFVQDSPKSEASNRRVPMSSKVLQLLEGLHAKSAEDWVFCGNDWERLTYEALAYQMKGACKAAGVPYLGLHCFRHTFATNIYHKGLDVKKLSSLLGHAGVAITYDIYIHMNEDDDAEILNIMG